MNYIAPAPVSAKPAFKTPHGLTRSTPLNTGNEAKFQLPVKKLTVSNAQKEKTLDNAPTVKNKELKHSNSEQSNTLYKRLNPDDVRHEASHEIKDDNALITGFENSHLISQDLIITKQNTQSRHEIAPLRHDNQNLTIDDNGEQVMSKFEVTQSAIGKNNSGIEQNINRESINQLAIASALGVPFNKQSSSNLVQKNGLPDHLNSADTKTQEIKFVAEKAMNNASEDRNSQSRDRRSQFVNVPIADKTGTRIEGVDLLQARSFPAISMSPTSSANGHNITQAILNSQQSAATGAMTIAQNPDPVYSASQPKALNTLKIQLHPAELGVVTAMMKLSGDDLHVQLRVDNMDAFRLLSDDSSSIVKAIRGQGFSIEHINIQLSSSDRGLGQQGNQQQNNQNNNPFLQSDTNSDQMKHQNNPNHDNQSINPGNHDNELLDQDNDALVKSQITALSDGVYL